jgi:AraC-like DNA-binding protein
LHTHPTYVIALITAGCERIRVGRDNVVARAGTVAIVNPEEWHDGERGADEGWAYRTFYPSVPLMTAIARDLGHDHAPIFPRATVEDRLLAKALAAAHEASTSRDAIQAETSLLIALRRLIVRHGDRMAGAQETQPSGSRQRFSLYQELVERKLGARLDLQQFAEAARVTRFQVIRDFKAMACITPSIYIRDRRVRRASLLIEQGLPLADAAIMAGFADQSHLSRAFRATHGITPGMFRSGGVRGRSGSWGTRLP